MPKINTKSNWMIWTVLVLTFGAATYVLRSVLLPFVAGIIIGYLLDPLAGRLEKMGLNRTLATILVMLLVIILAVPAIVLLFNMINSQISTFIAAVPNYVAALMRKMEPMLIKLQNDFPSLEAESIKNYLRDNMSNNLKLFGTVIKSVVSGGMALINLISLLLITPVVAFYMLRDWKHFIAKIRDLLPKSSKASIELQAKEIDRTLAGFLRGQFSVCLILGTFYAIGLHLCGLDLGLMVGFLAGLISFIPYVGSISGFLMSMALAFAQFNTWPPFAAVVGVFLVGQFLEGNFLTPKLVGDSVGLHPVWIMFALLSGGVLLGFLGLMIAVPVAAIIGVLLRHAIENYKKSDLYLK